MSHQKDQIDWFAIAATLRERFEGRAFEASVSVLLKRARGKRILVACSGGADSVFLLCLLASYAEVFAFELVVAHYNHRWRTVDSDEDAAFTAALARGLSLKFICGARPDNEAAFTETTARSLRLDFLRNAASQEGCAWIAFGHQLDDILETQLQRLARGCSSDGLAAPRPIARFKGFPPHIRPLLHLRAGEIRMALNACAAPWREDASNGDVSIERNALRHTVIPDLIEALDRNPVNGAARSRRLLEEDAVALDVMARRHLPAAFSGNDVLARAELRHLPQALLRRALFAWLSGHELIQSVSAPAMDVLLEVICGDKKKHRISAGIAYIMMDARQVWVEPVDVHEAAFPLEPILIEPGDSVILSTGAYMEMEYVRLSEAQLSSILQGEVDCGREAFIDFKQSQSFEVRGRQPGDRFRPLGAPGSKKLKDWFIDRQIPQKERKWLPVVTTRSGEIVWVPGFPPAESRKITRHMKTALRLTYQTRNTL
jgi:tRNA(Ile)-lysidine synthase